MSSGDRPLPGAGRDDTPAGSGRPAEWKVKSLIEAERVVNIQHRMLCVDAENIAHLYERIGWLSLPWWKRVYRRRPW